MRTARLVLVSVLGAGSLLVGCKENAGTNSQAAQASWTEDAALTSFYPTAYLARRIAGGLVAVDCPVPEGEDPIFWQPSRADLERYRGARLVILNGAEFEKWATTASLPSSRVVRSADGFQDRFLTFDTGITHSHGAAGEHSHEGIDGHTWLDPFNAIDQAKSIERAMSSAWPEHAEAFTQNLAALEADLMTLDSAFKALTPRLAGVKLLASHPAYDYLAARYGWTIANLDLDPEVGLTEEAIAEVAHAIGDHEGRAILLWESEPSETTFEVPFASVVFSPAELAGTGPDEPAEDYLAIMRANIARLDAALE